LAPVKQRAPHFPDAPAGSYVCEEGWLVINDQAWTEAEWSVEHQFRNRPSRRIRGRLVGRPRKEAQ
jgi:hypothetical protein